jgi:hypothetical protein
MKEIKIKNYENIENELFSNRLFFEECINSIKDGLINDFLIVPVLLVKLENNRKINVKCHRNEWDYILEKSLNFFIELEEYELCKDIKNLIDIK